MADSEEKRNQAAREYARMSDSELEILADEAWSLSDIGKDALRAELVRRGLKFELAAAARAEVSSDILVILRCYRDLPEALLAKSFLESADIESFLFDETTIRMNWLWSNLLGGMKHCVISKDADDAAQVLSQEIPEKFDVDGFAEFEQPRCPQCQSLNITFAELDKRLTWIVTYLLSIPVPIRGEGWECQSCGHDWEQPDDETSENT
jgi:hypothetical protein